MAEEAKNKGNGKRAMGNNDENRNMLNYTQNISNMRNDVSTYSNCEPYFLQY